MKGSNQGRKRRSQPNILELIKNHHEMCKDTFETIKDEESSVEEKREELFVFLEALKIHADVEQEVLYDCMDEVEVLHKNVIEAKTEHAIAEALIEELDGLNFKEEWNEEIEAKAKVLIDVVEHHIEEEEEEMFDAIEETFAEEELQALALEYATRFQARVEALLQGEEEDNPEDLIQVFEERMQEDPMLEFLEEQEKTLAEDSEEDEEFEERSA